MLRVALSKKLICAAFFPFSSIPDQVLDEKEQKISPHRIYMEKFKNIIWDEDGNASKEFQSVIHSTAAGIIAGFIFGGTANGKSATESFKKENQATLFENTFDAQKQLHIKASLHFIKGGLHFATKLGLFCFIFSTMSTGIYIYKEKFDILNHIYGGAITGFLFKVNMGIKGAFSGTLIGAILGTISGICTACLLWVTGYNLNNIYEFNSEIANARRQQIKKSSLSYLNKERNKIEEMYKADQQLDTAYVQQKE